MTGHLDYLTYNREERDLCAHLFRLLLEDQPRWQPLKDFIETDFTGSPRVFCEAALLRDAYHTRKPHKNDNKNIESEKLAGLTEFLNNVCELIAAQEKVSNNYTPFSKLEPFELRTPRETHPRQIAYKLKEIGALRMPGDGKVYGALQGMFNAKPDLVICVDNTMYIYEAKYHMPFDELQLERTKKIGQVWAELLHRDLGFDSKPKVEVRMLGLKKDKPQEGVSRYRFISWEKVLKIAKKQWNPTNKDWVASDYSMKVFSKVLKSDS
jgi:hypothetical protein